MKNMKKFPEIATFRITSRCNNNCKYCFGPPKNLKEMGLLKIKGLFRLFHEKGVKAIVLTGGEPSIREDFEDIIKELKKRGFKIFLDTNGDSFFKYKDLIPENIDVLGLPVDFPDKSYRNPNNLKTVFKILDFFKNKSPRPVIRIGTVVTQENFTGLEKIGNLLTKYPVDIWKIYEFTPQNINAVEDRYFLEIPSKQFDEITQKIKKRFSKYFKVSISKREDRNKAYFFVASDGTVFMPVDDSNICHEIKIGNVFDESIIEKWEKMVSESNYISNVKMTFRHP